MPWIRRKLRGNLVYVKADETGTPAADGRGRAEIVYKLAPGAKIYRASVRNLESTDDPADDEPFEAETPVGEEPPPPPPGDAIIVYTDGACTGNPGPMGLGAVIVDGAERLEISEYLGVGTNNIAELTAILRALEAVGAEGKSRTVIVHSDSSYSIGLLTKGWKAKKNIELVARLRALAAEFDDLRFVKVKGHAGVPENERADELATGAIAKRS